MPLYGGRPLAPAKDPPEPLQDCGSVLESTLQVSVVLVPLAIVAAPTFRVTTGGTVIFTFLHSGTPTLVTSNPNISGGLSGTYTRLHMALAERTAYSGITSDGLEALLESMLFGSVVSTLACKRLTAVAELAVTSIEL